MSESEVKKTITDEERLELINKLELDLETFIEGFEKKPYTEGWAEDSWEEEMQKHPFFMTKSPENADEVPTLLQGIQQLKYDESENSPLELALAYKDDGNFNFKVKKYRMAVISYTEGIRQKCGDTEIESSLYNNRSAAHFYLANYKSCLADCEKCLSFKDDHKKARLRAAECSILIKKPENAIKHCDKYLQYNPDEPKILKIKENAIQLNKELLRNERKLAKEEVRHEKTQENIVNAIKRRQLKIDCDSDTLLHSADLLPKLVEDDLLAWPVFFLYPEYSMSDFIEEFRETDTLLSILNEMFLECPQWDLDKKYVGKVINVYYEGNDRSKLYHVEDTNATLGKILSSKTYVIRDYKPAFLALVKGSIAEKSFLKQYTVLKHP